MKHLRLPSDAEGFFYLVSIHWLCLQGNNLNVPIRSPRVLDLADHSSAFESAL